MARWLIMIFLTLGIAIYSMLIFWITRRWMLPKFQERITFQDLKEQVKNDSRGPIKIDTDLAIFHFSSYAFFSYLFSYVAFTTALAFHTNIADEDIKVSAQISLLYEMWLDKFGAAIFVGIILLTVVIFSVLFLGVKILCADFLTYLLVGYYDLNEKEELKLLQDSKAAIEVIHAKLVATPQEERQAITSLRYALPTLDELRHDASGRTIPLVISSDSHMVDLSKGLRATFLIFVAQRIWFYNNWYGIESGRYFPRAAPGTSIKPNADEVCERMDQLLQQAITGCLAAMKKNYEGLFQKPLTTRYAKHPRSIRLIFGKEADLISSAKVLYSILEAEVLYPNPLERAGDIAHEASEIKKGGEQIKHDADAIGEVAEDIGQEVIKESAEHIGDEAAHIDSSASDITEIISREKSRQEGTLNIWISEDIGRRMKVEDWTEHNELPLFNKPGYNWETRLKEYLVSIGDPAGPTLFDATKSFGNNWPSDDFLAIGGKLYQPGYLEKPITDPRKAFNGFIVSLPIIFMGLNFKHALPFLELIKLLADNEDESAYYQSKLLQFQTKGELEQES